MASEPRIPPWYWGGAGETKKAREIALGGEISEPQCCLDERFRLLIGNKYNEIIKRRK